MSLYYIKSENLLEVFIAKNRVLIKKKIKKIKCLLSDELPFSEFFSKA